jgi:glycyl-tRNA synthetase
MAEALKEETLEKDTRILCSLHPALAPYKVAVLPLSKQLSESALVVFDTCAKAFSTTYDETASIGKRYRRQDAIGTPYCVTFDFDSLEDNCVTVRDRDSMVQERIAISDLVAYIEKRIKL